ncbi:Clavaminate synthase-like protein [Myriangium duriaei CBS 260.36]|uniref:Clavaminate synthase-like protein n=1 Tax=Myriangium duriaei CBS 260.36 TaxID=1168546 RepID=A0A9P4MJH1_9PEZI|nr:Clavaminate synthase-like protein [Myriangium duriaei CBS 260.36]
MSPAPTISTGVSSSSLDIPLIDFSPFLAPSHPDQPSTAAAILNAFRRSGFIYLRNFGISPSDISRTFAFSAHFFRLPQSEKDKLAWYSPRANRGYSAQGQEKVTDLTDHDEVAKLREEEGEDIKETMEIGREGEEDCPNLWPEGEEEFKEWMTGFFGRCKDVHRLVMRAVAVGLGIEEGWFDGYTDGGDNTLRLLHYPAVEGRVFRENSRRVRAGAHTDYGSITLLFQDERGGLQVRAPDGSYVDAKPIPDTIVVNAGDLLARWSNDVIRSTKHRVVEPPGMEEEKVHPARYSIAYFCNPNFDRFIDAIPGTYGEGNEKKYKGVNSGDYLEQRLTATY